MLTVGLVLDMIKAGEPKQTEDPFKWLEEAE